MNGWLGVRSLERAFSPRFFRTPYISSRSLRSNKPLSTKPFSNLRAQHSAIRWLYDFHILIFMYARLPQIYKNFAEGSTGELSVISSGMLLAGNAVRIFTSASEGSRAMLVGHLIGGALNLAIFGQIMWYWKATAAKAREAKEEAKKKSKKAE